MSIIYLFILIIYLTAIHGNSDENDTLQLIHVFSRHGSRTPEFKDNFPTHIYNTTSFHPIGWGQLTNEGKQRCYALGKVLRHRYSSFLGDTYYPDIIKTLTTDFDRTKSSAIAILAGLFPPTKSQKWDEGLHWNPIPFDYYHDGEDYLLRRPLKYCPAYVEELEKVQNSEYALNIEKEYEDVFKHISEHSGKPMKKLIDIFKINQVFLSETEMNLPQPDWVHNVFPNKTNYLASVQVDLENYNTLLRKLNGGRGLSLAVKNMVDKVNNKLHEGRKMYLYNAHENNIINILAALGIFKPHIPRYSAAVVLELHLEKKTSKQFVKIYYIKNVYEEPVLQKLKACDENCPFDKFLEIIKPVIPVNYTEECKSTINLDLDIDYLSRNHV